jgi:signal transduction histidine kinase/DNA-binding NarL/FixJ family response regulator
MKLLENSSKVIIQLIQKAVVFCSLLFIFPIPVNAFSGNLDLQGDWRIWRGDRPEYSNPLFDDSYWPSIRLPSKSLMPIHTARLFPEYPGSLTKGYYWLRKSFFVDESSDKRLVFQVGEIMNADETWLNGVKIGKTGDFPPHFRSGWSRFRSYPIEPDILKRGTNCLAIRVYFDAESSIRGPICLIDSASGNFRKMVMDFLFVNSMEDMSFLLLFVFIFFLTFYLIRIKEVQFLFFSLCCLSVALSISLQFMENHYSWLPCSSDFILRFSQTGLLFTGPMFFLFIHYYLFNKKIGWRLFSAILMPAIGCALMYLAPDRSSILAVRNIFLLLLPVFLVLMIFDCIKAILLRRPGAVFFTLAMTPLYLLSFHDVFTFGLPFFNDGLALFPFGFPLMLIIIAFRMIQDFVISLNTIDKQKEQLELHQGQLENLVAERTGELAAANEKLRGLDTAKTKFIANVSHELRTPLTLILGPLESVIQGDYGPQIPSGSPVFDSMFRNGSRLQLLINQLLDFSSIEVGKMRIRKVKTDVSLWLKQLISSVEQAATQKRISITVMDSTGGLIGFIDPFLTEKVVLNIVSNALKFTPEGGFIAVSLERTRHNLSGENGTFSIMVTDSGIGIAGDKLDRIFERFYQVDSESNRIYEGSGIGLSLAKEITELMGGRISVTSQPGAGSTFTVQIPATIPEGSGEIQNLTECRQPRTYFLSDIEAASYPSPDQDDQPSGIPENADASRILVVEDNPDMRRYLRENLGKIFHVVEAENGKQALKAALEHKPDLVLSDVLMPEMDGIEMVKEMRGIDGLRDVPIILLTARSGMESRVAGLESGAIDCIEKPFHIRELTARIVGQLQMKLLRDEILKKNHELSLSEARFREIADFSVSGIAETDRKFNLEFVNQTGRNLLGIPGGEQGQMSFLDCFAEEERDKIVRSLEADYFDVPLFKMVRGNGLSFTALVKSSRLDDGNGMDIPGEICQGRCFKSATHSGGNLPGIPDESLPLVL